ncbi:MAG: transketolase [Acidobacteriota bacterium]|nr:transketolase [Acidobacteriota bacterium]
MRLADHCGRFLAEEAHQDPRIWVLDGDLADSDGAHHFAGEHPRRFVMAGIAEQAMVSVAAGMARCGLRPFVFSFAAFLCYRAYDQVRVGLSQAGQPVVLVGSHSGGCASRNGKTHAAFNDLALMASLPRLQVWAPAGPQEVRLAAGQLLAGSEPGYLRLPRRPLEDFPGVAAPLRWLAGGPGDHAPRIALAGCGLGSHLAAAARRWLEGRGHSLGQLHLARVAPLPKGLEEALAGVETLLVVEDHYGFGGLASLLQERALPTRIIPLGWPRSWSGKSGDDDDLLALGGLDAEGLARQILPYLENS